MTLFPKPLLVVIITLLVVGIWNPTIPSATHLAQAASISSASTLPVSSDTSAQTTAPCPTQSFIDVTTYQQTQNYPAPILEVECTNKSIIVKSNGIPNFEFVQITPNSLTTQDYTWYIPLNPVDASETTPVPLLGSIAITVNGLPIFGPTEAPRDGYGDPFLDGILDYCNGHTAPGGVYHFHARPDCLFTDMDGNTSLVIGYAFDGYPILAPYICVDNACTEVKEVQSSWQRTQDVRNAWEAHEYVAGSGDLDECNGMVGPDGTYRYYATDTFPYFLGCYHGVANTSNTGVEGNNGMAQTGQGNPPTNGQNGQPPQDGQGNPPNGLPPQNGQGNPPPPNGNSRPPRR